MCGEKAGDIRKAKRKQGSPPRVRGKAQTSTIIRRSRRITPACAGKRSEAPKGQQQERDHPRVCGEKPLTWFWQGPCLGSPPRVRGKADFCISAERHAGITPACAGKRAPFQKMSTAGRDHPRVCGEKVRCAAGCGPPKGSPPRVRGKADFCISAERHAGITPACAGKSHHLPAHTGEVRDHPRVCGEKGTPWHNCGSPQGSPPRVRGKV